MPVFHILAKYLLLNPRVAPAALRLVPTLHNKLYDLCGVLAVTTCGGVHPKHRLLRYKEWFLDQIAPEWVVLDIGSNTGAMPALLAEKAQYVYGIEIDPQLSEIAKRINDTTNVEFLTSDATTFDYSSCRPIDCVTLSNVLEHIRDRVGFIRSLLARLPWRDVNHRIFLIRVPTIERDWLAAYKKEVGVEYRLDRTHEIEHTRQELVAELEIAGLTITNFEVRFGEYYAVCRGAQ
jgi:SAM-dependent methyltransferase